MRRGLRSLMSVTAIGGLAALAAPGTAVAGGNGSTTYSGIFAGDIRYQGCTSQPPWETTSGTWSVTLHGTSATGVFDIYTDGQPHVAYTFPGMKDVPTTANQVFAETGLTGAGQLTVTLTDKGKFAYTITDYNLYWADTDQTYVCDSVTFPGRLSG
jgi:hypothetical protein